MFVCFCRDFIERKCLTLTILVKPATNYPRNSTKAFSEGDIDSSDEDEEGLDEYEDDGFILKEGEEEERFGWMVPAVMKSSCFSRRGHCSLIPPCH